MFDGNFERTRLFLRNCITNNKKQAQVLAFMGTTVFIKHIEEGSKGSVGAGGQMTHTNRLFPIKIWTRKNREWKQLCTQIRIYIHVVAK